MRSTASSSTFRSTALIALIYGCSGATEDEIAGTSDETGLLGVKTLALSPAETEAGRQAIAATYAATGGSFGPLGLAISAVVATPDGLGLRRVYAFGEILWKPATGAHSVNGEIWFKWNAFGLERGLLGYPLTNGTITPDLLGVFNHFERGSIYWTPFTGAFEIHGLVQQKWNALGAERGFLGYPITDHLATPDLSGAYSHFQGGAIYWTPATGAREIHGAILDKWKALGWERSVLGYPTSDELVTPDGVGRYNHFQRGSIYWSPSTGAREVHGAIRERWASLGWERSTLGYPTSDELAYGTSGRVSRFQGGSLYWSACSGVTLAPPNCGGSTVPPPGQCRTDAHCTGGFTCNNPWGNAFGTCQGSILSYPYPAKGRIEYSSGPDHNACTTNAVPNELEAMRELAFTQVSYGAREEQVVPPDGKSVPDLGTLLNATDHVQSIARIPGLGNSNWMAVTISNASVPQYMPPGRGGVFFIELGELNGNHGEPFRAGRKDNRTLNVNRAYYELPNDHPGGMQIVGRTAVIAGEKDYEENQDVVYFIDVSNPTGKPLRDALYSKFRLASQFYPPGIPAWNTQPSAAAVVRMDSGGYLMAVNTNSTQNPAKIWLFLTDSTSIRSPNVRWYPHNYVEVPAGPGAENMNFVTECDGTVYLLVTGNPQGGSNGENGISNRVNAYELVKSGSKLALNLVYNRGYFRNQEYADFRAAATFYVSPNGELLLYSNSRSLLTEDGNYRMAEFAVSHFCGLGGC